jgi:two-component system sensor histidine kinase YesM
MGQVEKGKLDIQLESDRSDELGRLTASFNRMTREYRQNLERSVQRERELNETRLSMFQAQLNPHFLYNTLDSMKWLGITNKVPQVADMATDLASLLRAAVSGNKVISLEGELELLERYLDIQSLRFGDSFTWEMDIPDCLQHCLIPKLVLQPLVENAIIHGVADMPDGYIKISARAENNDLLLSVSDNGQGMSPELLACLNSPDRELPEGHLGLNNVQRIVRLYYGDGYGISAKAGEKGGSVVQIRLPMVKKEVEDA